MNTLIVGGGWSGLAAAITLTDNSMPVTVLEAAPVLGGRARSLPWLDLHIDNGQHLLIGAYQRFLRLLELIGGDADQLFQRRALDLTIYDNEYPPLSFSAANLLPWPASIAYSLCRSVGWSGLRHVLKLQRQIPSVMKQADQPLLPWLQQTGQSARLIKQLWEPLCLGALNTPLEHASAHLFAKVIQQSLMQGKTAADLLLPNTTLAAVFPDLAARFIRQHGGRIELQRRVRQLHIDHNKLQGLELTDGTVVSAENIILATPLTETIRLTAAYMDWSEPQHYPITTVYLQYPASCRLHKPMLGSTGTLLQWLFDRSDLKPGLMAAVVSGPGPHQTINNRQLVQQLTSEIASFCAGFPDHTEHYRVIREKRATFASTVNINQQRPTTKTRIPGLWLAGDFVANGLPATLEGAVGNGIDSARLLLKVDNQG